MFQYLINVFQVIHMSEPSHFTTPTSVTESQNAKSTVHEIL